MILCFSFIFLWASLFCLENKTMVHQKYVVFVVLVLSLAANLMKTENFLFAAHELLSPMSPTVRPSFHTKVLFKCLQLKRQQLSLKLDQTKFICIFCPYPI